MKITHFQNRYQCEQAPMLQEDLWVLYKQAATAGVWFQMSSSGFHWAVIYCWLCPSSAEISNMCKAQARCRQYGWHLHFSSTTKRPSGWKIHISCKGSRIKIAIFAWGESSQASCLQSALGRASRLLPVSASSALLLKQSHLEQNNWMFNRAERGNEHTGLIGKKTQGPGPIPALVLQDAEQMGSRWWSQTYPPAFWLNTPSSLYCFCGITHFDKHCMKTPII